MKKHAKNADVVSGFTLSSKSEGVDLKAGALQKAIFDSANFSSIATDAKGVIQIFNVGAERMLGYTALEVMNQRTPADISDSQEVITRASALSAEFETPIEPGFEALVFKASRGIEDIYELTYIRKDGSRFPAVVSVTALRDDQDDIIGYLLIGTDNTARQLVEEERKKLDQRLRDQQFYTRSLIEANIDAIMTTDPAGIITDVNKQTEELTNCTRDELIGAPFKKFFTDPKRAVAAINMVLSGKKITNYELTVRARDGKETVVSYNATTFYDRDRVLQGVFAAARDVTESKRLDLVLQEKNIELESSRAVADNANLAKSDFLSSMSHEIRSPLNAILGLAYLLEQLNLDMDAHAMVRKIRASGRILLSLISDILDVSKIEAGQMMIEQAPFRLTDVIDSLSVVLGVAVGEKNIELIIHPPPEVPGIFTLTGDALRLEQVLINLSINAIKFTSQGQVELRTELVSRSDDEVVLRFSVRDTGIGIAPELQGSVFSAFTQADSTTTRRFGGTGLGLTICRQLVQLMGGQIGLTSVVGKGSEFWFSVPLKTIRDGDQQEEVQQIGHTPQALSQPDNATPTLAGKPLQGIRVLVVDDGEINCEVARRILIGHGSVVFLASNGQEAIDWLVAHPSEVDLVLMDVQMPVMGGIEATRLLRLMPKFAHLPIVALTAGAFKSQQDAAHAVGMTHFISKPFDVPSTITLIQRLTRQAVINASNHPLAAAWTPDVAVINVTEGMKIWADMPSYLEWLGRFIALYAGTVPSMRGSLAVNDKTAVVALGHKLAGVAANLALPEVFRTAAEVERVLGSALDQTLVDIALVELAAAMDSAVATIGRMTADKNLFEKEIKR